MLLPRHEDAPPLGVGPRLPADGAAAPLGRRLEALAVGVLGLDRRLALAGPARRVAAGQAAPVVPFHGLAERGLARARRRGASLHPSRRRRVVADRRISVDAVRRQGVDVRVRRHADDQ